MPNIQNKQNVSSNVLAWGQLLLLVFASIYVIPFTFHGYSYEESFGLLMWLSTTLFMAFTLIALVSKFKKVPIKPVFRIVTAVASIIILCSLAVIAYGFWQDFIGAYCTGLFGHRQSCVNSQQFLVQFALFMWVYPIIGALCLIASLSQIKVLLADKTKK